MSGGSDEQAEISVDRIIEFRRGSVLTPAERAKLKIILEEHRELLILLSH